MANDDRTSLPDGVEWVELKVTLGGTQVDLGLRAFDLDPEGAAAERREIYFCERVGPPSDPMVLPLLARGIILRIRKNQDSPDDSTLKLRGQEGSVDPTLWRGRTRAFGDDAKIEGDWAADRRLVSASLDSKVEGGRIDEVVADRPHQVRRLLSKAQEGLAADLLLGLDGLELLDPIQARRWKGPGRSMPRSRPSCGSSPMAAVPGTVHTRRRQGEPSCGQAAVRGVAAGPRSHHRRRTGHEDQQGAGAPREGGRRPKGGEEGDRRARHHLAKVRAPSPRFTTTPSFPPLDGRCCAPITP
jgi:hypothetical protein